MHGVFAVRLADFPAGTFDGNVWLEIKIGEDAPLSPRQQLVSAPYAFKAGSVADGAITGASIAAGTITADKFAFDVSNSLAWLLGGNAGTDPATHFLGTTDDLPLVFRTNNTERLRILPDGSVGIGTDIPNAKTHIVGGPIWTSNGWTKSLALNNAAALELGYGTSNRFGLGASGGNLYLFTTPVEDNSVAANYRMVVNGSNGNVGFGIVGATAPFPVTVQTSIPNYGFMHTAGAVTVGTYANSTGGWFGTYSNHPLFLYTNNGEASMTVTTAGNVGIGTSTPAYRLDVSGSARVAVTGGTAFSAFSPSSTGVSGSSTSGSGVYGISVNGDGVQGSSSTAWGVRGFSNNSIGVYGGTGSSAGVGVYGQGSGNGYAVFANGNAGGLSQWFSVSDARYKTNVHTLGNALDNLLRLRGVSYDWDRAKWPKMNFMNGREIGFLAQEMESVFPECVHTDANGFKSVAYANVVPVLVEAVKTLNARTVLQQKQIDALKSVQQENAAKDKKITEIQTELDALKAAVRELQNNRK